MTKEYIISEEQIKEIREGCYHEIFNVLNVVESRPLEQEKQAAVNAVLDDLWKFCLINGAEEHGDLIGAPNDPFFTLKLLKKIAEMRYNFRQQTGTEEQQRGREE